MIIELTQEQLQQYVAGLLPIQTKRYFLTLSLDDAKITLRQDQRIGLDLHLTIKGLLGVQGNGVVHLNGNIKYHRIHGSFHIEDLKVEAIHVRYVPDQALRQIRPIIELTLGSLFDRYPLYTLKNDNSKHQLAKATLRSISVRDCKLVINVGFFK